MPMGRPKADLVLEPAERAQLQSMVRSRSIPAALQVRAQIVLASANGEPNSSIAARLGYTNATVVNGVVGLSNVVSPGCMTNCGRVSRGRSTMSGWPN